MIFRIIILLGCIVVFINGCNSLISLNFGTHKLRSFTMEEVIETGIGDSDFIEIRNAWQTGDFVYVPPERSSQSGIVIYPLVSDSQMKGLEKGDQVKPAVIAWSETDDPECVTGKDCVPKKKMQVKGLIRELSREKDRREELPANRYDISGRQIFLEAGEEPLAWYWNLAMMAITFVIAFGVEYFRIKKENLEPIE